MRTKTIYYVNEQVVRLVASAVVILTVVWLVTGWQGLGVFLTIDFFLRAFTAQPSPLAALAKRILDKAGIAQNPIFAPPKRFAAGLGFVFSVAILVLLQLEWGTVGYIVGGILIFCATLESIFKVCLGCYVYNGIVAPVLAKLQKRKS